MDSSGVTTEEEEEEDAQEEPNAKVPFPLLLFSVRGGNEGGGVKFVFSE